MDHLQKQAPASHRNSIKATVAPAQKHVWRGVMGSIAELCGTDVAQDVQSKLAGGELVVPLKHIGKGPLSKLRPKSAHAVIKHFAGQKLYIPSALARARDTHGLFLQVEELISKGQSVPAVARTLGISETYVYRLRRKFDAPPIGEIRKQQQLVNFMDA